jgi:uncharacterized protein YjaG (DUF416 family)
MDKFRNEVKDLIEGLPNKGKILFAVLTSEKLYPNYIAFENISHWGNHKILEDAISFIFQYIINEESFIIPEIEDMISRIDLVTPDTEDFPGILTSFALDACTSILDILQFIIDKNAEHIVDVAIYARDTVDMFIQERDDMNSLDPSIDIQIEHDDFMLKEKSRQRKLIATLANIDLEIITDELLNRLRTTESIIDLSQLT